jgi:hypothetical protein
MYDYIATKSYVNGAAAFFDVFGKQAATLGRRRTREDPNPAFLASFLVFEVQPDAAIAGFEEGSVNVDCVANHLSDGCLAHDGLQTFEFLRCGGWQPKGESLSVLFQQFPGAH